MSLHSSTQSIPRVVVCTMAAAVAFVLTDPLDAKRPFAFELEMSSPAEGAVQVFFDRGAGIREADSVTGPIYYSAAPTRYRLPLEAASYRLFRIDPNDKPGRYTITAMRLVTEEGRTVSDIPLSAVHAAAQAHIELTPQGLQVDVPTGSNDPQLVFAPPAAIRLVAEDWPVQRAATIAAVALTLLALFLVIERATKQRQLTRFRALIGTHPHAAVMVTAIIATALATYPLFVGRSLVSPNNGGAAMIYDHPPYTYGSHDVVLESTRGTDIGSMMWAILPYASANREALGFGEFPLWNRYNALGRPLWGQGQTFFLEPVHFLSLALNEPSYRADVTFVAGRLIFAVGVGFAALAAVGAPAASLVVTAAAPFIGYFIFRFNHPAYFSIIYAPWILWSYYRLASRVRPDQIWRAALPLIAFSVLQMLGSTPKEGMVAFAIAHLAGFFAVAFTPASSRVFAARIGCAVVAATLTMMLTAPYWLIFLDTLGRSFTAYDVPLVVYAGWHEVAALAGGAWLPETTYPSLNGLLAVLAGVGALSPFVVRTHPAVVGATVAAVMAIVVACGVIPASAMSSLPFLGNLYHVWNVFLTASLTPTMVVAAAGMVAIRRAPRQSLLICVLVVIAFALMMFAGWVYDPRTLPRALVASLVPALAFAVLLAIPGQWRTIPIALATVVALLLACLPGGLHLETGVRILDRTLLQPRPRADLDNPSPAIRAVQHQEAGEPFRIASLLNTVYPGIQSYFDLEGITGPDALELREFRELTDAAGILRTQWGWRTLLVERDLTSARGYLDMIGVRYVLASREQPPRMPANLPRLALDAPDELEVVRRDSAWPRAFFVDGVRRHSSVFDVVREATTDAAPFVSVATEDATAIAAVGHLPVRETRRVAAREYRLTSNHTAFVVDAPGPGIVAVTEPYVARDFRATINGSSVDYIQVNHLYKGVVIPAAGTWHVDFEYRPARWTQAWVISGVAGIAFVALLLLTRARNGRAPSGGAFQVAGNGI